MTQDEAQYYAYMDYDTASAELKETIMAARNQIIYSQSWVADGFECYVISPDGTQKKVLAFSELFPDWEIPTVDIDKSETTADGLGSNEQYGIFVEVMEIENDFLKCRVSSIFAPFEEGQNIRVYFSDGCDFGDIEVGDTVMVSFYGKDADSAEEIIYAKDIIVRP